GTPEVAKQLEVLRDRVSNEYLPAFSGVSSINELSTQLLRSFMQDVPTLVEIVRREHEVQRDIDSIGTPAQRTAPSSGSQRMLTTMLSLNAIALLR
ncbi:MAG: hypothetical protein KDD42_10280, partial [Bdellovibrionales bacterium]|nr:hypothetical protein [Bdellovibrionales bacterium]